MDAERIDEACEKTILGLVLAALVFGPLALGGVRASEFLVLEIIAALAGLLWLLRLWLKPGERVFWPPIAWFVLLFTGYAGVRLAGSPIAYVAREECERVLLYAMFFLITLNNVNRQESPSWVAAALLTIGTLLSTYALYQFVTESNRVWTLGRPEVYARRGSGTYICPNHLAGFLELILPLGLAYTLIGRLGHTTRVLAGYATVMILMGIAATISRGGWVAAGLSLFLFLALLSRQPSHRLPALLAAVVLIGASAYFASRSEAITKRFEKMLKPGQLDYALQRFYLWKPAAQMWRDHLWTGVGPAHFDYRFRQYRPPDYQVRPVRAHNDYLNTLADWGVAGATIVLGAFVALFAGVAKTWRFVQRSTDLGSRTSNRFAFVLGGTCGLFALLCHAMVDFNFHIPANALAAVVIMALMSVHLRFATDAFWVSTGWISRITISLLVAAGSFALGFSAVQTYREQRPLADAEHQSSLMESSSAKLAEAQSKDEQDPALVQDLIREINQAARAYQSALEEAHRAAPDNPDTAYRLGEALRLSVWQRNSPATKDQLHRAMDLYSQSALLNPFDPYAPLRHGMCLDHLKRHDEARPYYERALKLDPNGYYTAAHMGWHHAQRRAWAEAKEWFERSLQLKPATMPDANPIAYAYLKIVNRMLAGTP